MAQEERNYVHEAENWRQRVSVEIHTAKAFEENWGFLTQESTAVRDTISQDKRPHHLSLVKYFNPHSPSWTVEAKRVPLPYGKTNSNGDEGNPALRRALANHEDRLKVLHSSNSQYRPTSRSYGSRQTIETFGVAHFGLKRTLGEPYN
uniref:Uncharacterized protein n=1 Tax=Tetraselmis sp. GSL018 TaxID=582737 RepID=A0A061RKJ9_9CHLO